MTPQTPHLPRWAQALRQQRTELGWDVHRLAVELVQAAGRHNTATAESLTRRIRAWEAGSSGIRERYRLLLAQVLQVDPEVFADQPVEPGAPAQASRIRATSAHLVSLDVALGGTDLVPAAVRAAHTAHASARAGASADVVSAAAEALQVAGWLAFDADEHVLARRLTSASVLAARVGEDRGGELFALSQLAMHDAHECLPLQARQVCEHVLDEQLSSRLTCLFELRLARSQGQSNTPIRALGTLRRARSRLQDGANDDDPPWAWWITEGELTWHEAMIHADNGNWDRAQELFALAREQRPARYPRGPLVDAVHQLHALVHLRAWGAAQEVLTTAVIPAVGQVRSARTNALLARTVGLSERAAAPMPVRELMRAASAAAY
ncbi:DNA-binding protein [Nocardiopsis synnemataformans]|uniref:DNA-binding protein n=1 Tax=Nocardiopsis synnemataformans TaxID=61305 RepID=UPI003EBABD6B